LAYEVAKNVVFLRHLTTIILLFQTIIHKSEIGLNFIKKLQVSGNLLVADFSFIMGSLCVWDITTQQVIRIQICSVVAIFMLCFYTVGP